MESYCEINVSKNGKHFFATAQRSAKTIGAAADILEVFKLKFPENEGYKINVTYWECTGRRVQNI
jgi:hypothetical protein